MKHKSLLAASALLCLAASVAYADEATKTAKVEEFLRLSKVDEKLRQGMDLAMRQVKAGVVQQIMGVKLPPDQETALGEFQDKVARIVSDALAWEKLKPAYVKLFTEAYSEAELDDIIAFYRSPTGQSMVAKAPSLMAKASEIAQQRLATVMPELQALTRDFGAQAAKTTQPAEKK
jgi:hypothetical protein